MSGWQGIANLALTALMLGAVFGVCAICAAISNGETPGVKVLGQSAVFFLLLAAALGTLLGLAAVWSS